MRIIGPSILVILLLVSFPIARGTDMLEVLCTGSAGSMSFMAAVLRREPMTDAVIIPTRVSSRAIDVTHEVVKRYMRLYFPRSYGDLVDDYEFLILRGIDSTFFTSNQMEWMRRSIEEDGLGALQDRSVMSSLTSYSLPWAESVLSEAFPNDADSVVSVDYSRHGPMNIVINDDRTLPGVLRPYAEVFPYHIGSNGLTMMIPKAGSREFSWCKCGSYAEFAYPEPGTFPHTLGWRYGEGYTWSIMDYSAQGFWGGNQNPYGLDAYWGLLMYSTGRALPDDVFMIHELRARFHDYAEVKGFILSLMDFVDRFGANTRSLAMSLKGMDGEWVRARESYLNQEYETSWSIIGEVLDRVSSLRADALEIKDRALTWIYMVEWLVVSGTNLMAAFAVWSLMVRRRLYKSVGTTRLD